MPTISIPHFNLSEFESGSRLPWPKAVCNEIRVPISTDSPATAQKSRNFPSGNLSLSVEQPVKNSCVASPSDVPLTSASKQSRPLNQGPLTVDTVDTPGVVDSKQVQIDSAIAKPTEAILRLTDCILERFPTVGSSIIMFAGSQANPLTSMTCSNVAHLLARKTAKTTLLVDSSRRRELTQMYQTDEKRGLNNLLTDYSDWRPEVLRLSQPGLDFLPAGNSHWEHWGAEDRLRHLAAELRRTYQFVCVAADDPQQVNSKIWTGICDGSFLLVSQRTANPAIAASNVVEMQKSGARLLGCVVTDADSVLSC